MPPGERLIGASRATNRRQSFRCRPVRRSRWRKRCPQDSAWPGARCCGVSACGRLRLGCQSSHMVHAKTSMHEACLLRRRRSPVCRSPAGAPSLEPH